MAENKGGRPKKYTQERISEIIKEMDKYTQDAAIPFVEEFSMLSEELTGEYIPRETFYQIKEFSHTRKKLIQKQILRLKQLGLKGTVNTTMAIFLLKNHGLTDVPRPRASEAPDDTRFIDAIGKAAKDAWEKE